MNERLIQEVEALTPELHTLSKQLYDHPEVAFQEHKACEWLSAYLEGKGFAVERQAGGVETAFYASMPGREGKPKVALLAEYDALPKIGHGCGHNLIAAASVGAGVALSRCLDGIKGSVVVVGTPAEEGGGGKIMLLDAGKFDDVDAAMMFHPGNRTVVGDDSLGRIKFTVEFFGKTAHAAGSPADGINALDAIITFFSSIGLLRQQLKDEARIHGIITHGGDAPNVIPDYTSALMYVRTLDLAYLDKVFEKVENCAKGAALATGTEVKVTQNPMRYAPRKRSFALENVCQKHMEVLGLTVKEPLAGKLGSTDLGNLSQKVPAIHPSIAIVDEEVPGHSIQITEATMSPRGQEAMVKAAKMLALTAYEFLNSEELQEEVAREFRSA